MPETIAYQTLGPEDIVRDGDQYYDKYEGWVTVGRRSGLDRSLGIKVGLIPRNGWRRPVADPLLDGYRELREFAASLATDPPCSCPVEIIESARSLVYKHPER